MTKALIIAAGMGKRLLPYTQNIPKTKLPVFGSPLIEHIISNIKTYGVNDFGLITGYKKEALEYLNCDSYFHNENYETNNILHSLMKARPYFEKCIKENEDLIITYSDIYYKKNVVESLMGNKGDFVIVSDSSWENLYINRNDNPLSEGEMVEYNDHVVQIGKEIPSSNDLKRGEFIGLLKLSPEGIKKWLFHFDRVDHLLSLDDKFQRASSWAFSYLTDFIQELVDLGEKVKICEINNDWLEFDTLGDYKRVLEFETLDDFQELYRR